MFARARKSGVLVSISAALIVGVGAIGLTGCTTTKLVETNRVVISGKKYSPPAIKVKIGDTVTFINEDDVDHTVTADDFPTPNQLLAPGADMGFVPGEELDLKYHCEIHKFRGKIVVVAQSG